MLPQPRDRGTYSEWTQIHKNAQKPLRHDLRIQVNQKSQEHNVSIGNNSRQANPMPGKPAQPAPHQHMCHKAEDPIRDPAGRQTFSGPAQLNADLGSRGTAPGPTWTEHTLCAHELTDGSLTRPMQRHSAQPRLQDVATRDATARSPPRQPHVHYRRGALHARRRRKHCRQAEGSTGQLRPLPAGGGLNRC